MFKIKKIIFIGFPIFIAFFLYLNNSVSANNIINFDNFVSNIKLVKFSKKNISLVKFSKDFNNIKYHKCNIDRFDDYLEISAVCMLKQNGNMPILSIEQSLDFLIDDLGGFYNYYNLADSFSYRPTSAYFKKSSISVLLNDYKKYESTIYKKIVITYLEHNNTKIRIYNNILARNIFEEYSFYVVPTDLSMRSVCSLANYRAAISHLDGLELSQGQELNLNNLISYDPNSCRGTTKKKYMFYAGACGSSTQLFRLSLIMPYLDVVERYPHSKRWAYYYGAKIAGDDAAMYENSKKMIIKNNFDTSIYFKVYEQGDKSYLVGVVPKKLKDRVKINKTSNGLSSSVTKNIYNSQNKLINIYQFDSHYSFYNPYRN